MKNVRISKETVLSCLVLLQTVINAELHAGRKAPESMEKAEVELQKVVNSFVRMEKNAS